MLRVCVCRCARTPHQKYFSSHIKTTPCGLHVDRSLPKPFNKILIANRGEIAIRVMRTCKEIGVKTVAVYSDADKDSLHTQMADEAYRIGPPAAAESYLRADKILDICKQSGAQAVHPGYGFLSENATFADACKTKGIILIGPPASAMRDMGSKSASKIIMTKANVPVVPGYHGEDQSIERLQHEAEQVGYPLMIKAVLGGGGKGMRIVRKREELVESIEACRREAKKSFNSELVLMERYIERPRHIEFQVFADQHGNAVHFWERDCSVQRRHQKVLEEAPAPGMPAALREVMGQAAVNAAKAVKYEGAGTVEFIFDAVKDDYFFMEMNTRLQVEHPVTEMVMQRDLVQLQLHVAAGHPLPCTQQELFAHGHAVEARIYAESPHKNFLPMTGRLDHLRTPAVTPTCRVESGVREGDEVSIYYDPMIAKLIVSGNDRLAALQAMSTALESYEVVGPPTNIEFLKRAVAHPAFVKGKVETGFIADNLAALVPAKAAAVPPHITSLAILSLLTKEQHAAADNSPTEDEYSPWSAENSFRVNVTHRRKVQLNIINGDETTEKIFVEVETISDEEDAYNLHFGKEVIRAQVESAGDEEDREPLVAIIGDQRFSATVREIDDSIHVFVGGTHTEFAIPRRQFGSSAAAGGPVAPMSGKVVKVLVKPGDTVKPEAQLVIMEAMKMEHVIRSKAAGVVKQVLFKEGDFVAGGKVVVVFEEEAKKN